MVSNYSKIACRCAVQLEASIIAKIAMSCDVKPGEVITVRDVASTYYVPVLLAEQGLITSLSKLLRLDLLTKTSLHKLNGANMWKEWKIMTAQQDEQYGSVTIAIVGKYTSFIDSYVSVVKALQHSAMACRRKLNLIHVNSSRLEESTCTSSRAEYDEA